MLELAALLAVATPSSAFRVNSGAAGDAATDSNDRPLASMVPCCKSRNALRAAGYFAASSATSEIEASSAVRRGAHLLQTWIACRQFERFLICFAALRERAADHNQDTRGSLHCFFPCAGAGARGATAPPGLVMVHSVCARAWRLE
jgi:hypothetical protein